MKNATIEDEKLAKIKEMAKTGTLEEGKKLFDMNYHIISLLDGEPFFASISRHVEKNASLALPTAGVRITSDGHYEMIYNPYFFASLPTKQRAGVLKHEFYHLIFEHVSTRLPEGGMNKLWNIATDLAINSHLPDEIPELGCIPGRSKFAYFPSMKSSEFYYAELLKKQEENEENGEGDTLGDSMDDHSGWGENADGLDPTVKEIAKQRLKEMLKTASEEANKKNWGSVSSAVRQDVLDRISGCVDWRNVLRYFVRVSQRADKHNTVRRINKRYPFIHPGCKVQRQAKIAVAIDQSGSVGNELLVKFFSELNNLSKIATFDVLPFDSSLDEKDIYTWKKGTHKKAERVKYGGTDFTCVAEYCNKRDYDGLIMLTDMYAPKPIGSKCNRMWMTDKENAKNPYFTTNERIIAID